MTVPAESYAEVSRSIIGVGILLSSFAQLSARRNLADGGFYDWEVVRARLRWTRAGPVARRLEPLFAYPAVLAIIALQAVTSAVLAFHITAWMVPTALFVLILTHLLFRLRTQWGVDGSDQITSIVLIGLFCFYLAPSGLLRTICLVFIAAETVLCYFSAGLAKLFDHQWRSGAAIPMIARCREFGIPQLSALLDRHCWLGLLLCWSTITWEVGAPLFVALGPRACLSYLGMGVFFHLSVAVVMGLSDFIWGFISTYPAVLYLSTLVPGT